MPFPAWDFEVELAYIEGGEAVAGSVLQSFLGTFLACRGAGGFFLFTDPCDCAVTDVEGVLLNVTPGAAAPMGQSGDGVSQQFQLARKIGIGLDVLQIVPAARVMVNGADVNYGVSEAGVVTFDTPPPDQAMLTWSGDFRYLCQFTDDTLRDLTRVSRNSTGLLWSCSSVTFEGVLL